MYSICIVCSRLSPLILNSQKVSEAIINLQAADSISKAYIVLLY